jgi:hypothetical protein
MSSACTHQILTARPVPHVATPAAHAVLGRFRAGMARLAERLWNHELPAERAYARLLEGSAGKLTDSLERDAERSMRMGSGFYG